MKKMACLILLITFAAKAGDGWVGSGGELFKDAHNPWFVKNTAKVSYCVEIDQPTVSADEATILSEIEFAIKYWKKEFQKANATNGPGAFSIGTQEFIKTNCTAHTPLRFKVGYGTLDQAEKDFLKVPEKFIGISVRTEYDQKNLIGKGFIYISSDIGPHAYENNGQLLPKAWTRKKLLRYAFLHEVGHVMGIPHMGNGLMSQNFLNQLLNKYLVNSFESLPLESFVRPDDSFQACEIDRKIKTFVFGLTSKENCLQINYSSINNSYELNAVDEHGQLRKIGEVNNLSLEISDIKSLPVSTLHLTKKQVVFGTDQTLFRDFMFGPMMQDQGYRGVLVLDEDPMPKKVYLRVMPNSFSMLGTFNKGTVPFVIKQSPLSLILMKDPTP